MRYKLNGEKSPDTVDELLDAVRETRWCNQQFILLVKYITNIIKYESRSECGHKKYIKWKFQFVQFRFLFLPIMYVVWLP